MTSIRSNHLLGVFSAFLLISSTTCQMNNMVAQPSAYGTGLQQPQYQQQQVPAGMGYGYPQQQQVPQSATGYAPLGGVNQQPMGYANPQAFALPQQQQPMGYPGSQLGAAGYANPSQFNGQQPLQQTVLPSTMQDVQGAGSMYGGSPLGRSLNAAGAGQQNGLDQQNPNRGSQFPMITPATAVQPQAGQGFGQPQQMFTGQQQQFPQGQQFVPMASGGQSGLFGQQQPGLQLPQQQQFQTLPGQQMGQQDLSMLSGQQQMPTLGVPGFSGQGAPSVGVGGMQNAGQFGG